MPLDSPGNPHKVTNKVTDVQLIRAALECIDPSDGFKLEDLPLEAWCRMARFLPCGVRTDELEDKRGVFITRRCLPRIIEEILPLALKYYEQKHNEN